MKHFLKTKLKLDVVFKEIRYLPHPKSYFQKSQALQPCLSPRSHHDLGSRCLFYMKSTLMTGGTTVYYYLKIKTRCPPAPSIYVQATGQLRIFYDIHQRSTTLTCLATPVCGCGLGRHNLHAVSDKKIFKILLLRSYTEKQFNQVFAILNKTIWMG